MRRRISRRVDARDPCMAGEFVELDDTAYGACTMRPTHASLICRRTKNFGAIRLLIGHTKQAEVWAASGRTAVGHRPARQQH